MHSALLLRNTCSSCSHCHRLLQNGRCYQAKVIEIDQMAHEVRHQAFLLQQPPVLAGKIQASLRDLLVCNDPAGGVARIKASPSM